MLVLTLNNHIICDDINIDILNNNVESIEYLIK